MTPIRAEYRRAARRCNEYKGFHRGSGKLGASRYFEHRTDGVRDRHGYHNPGYRGCCIEAASDSVALFDDRISIFCTIQEDCGPVLGVAFAFAVVAVLYYIDGHENISIFLRFGFQAHSFTPYLTHAIIKVFAISVPIASLMRVVYRKTLDHTYEEVPPRMTVALRQAPQWRRRPWLMRRSGPPTPATATIRIASGRGDDQRRLAKGTCTKRQAKRCPGTAVQLERAPKVRVGNGKLRNGR